MLKSFKPLASLILASALFTHTPAFAQDIVVKAHATFRDLEYDYDDSDRVERAKAWLKASIPEGLEVFAARAIVRDQGAHCGAAVQDGQTRCVFSSLESVEDHLHDVVWTVQLNSRHGRIASVDVSRSSIGS